VEQPEKQKHKVWEDDYNAKKMLAQANFLSRK
jgi:hypothetical protein